MQHTPTPSTEPDAQATVTLGPIQVNLDRYRDMAEPGVSRADVLADAVASLTEILQETAEYVESLETALRLAQAGLKTDLLREATRRRAAAEAEVAELVQANGQLIAERAEAWQGGFLFGRKAPAPILDLDALATDLTPLLERLAEESRTTFAAWIEDAVESYSYENTTALPGPRRRLDERDLANVREEICQRVLMHMPALPGVDQISEVLYERLGQRDDSFEGEAKAVLELFTGVSARQAAAAAWAEGVSTTLNYARRVPNTNLLKLVTHEGEPWPNPYGTMED